MRPAQSSEGVRCTYERRIWRFYLKVISFAFVALVLSTGFCSTAWRLFRAICCAFIGCQRNNSMNKINAPLAAALLMSGIPANAVQLSCQTSTAQLEQKTTKNEPFVIQRLYPAARVKSDCARAIQIAAQGDEAAMDKMIEQDRITFFAAGTRVYSVRSAEMGTWWLVREKGSTEKWWISVRAFSQD